ncbi:hypothetical protein Droror1_Dr00018281 [Drosera rotundifolia]
MTTKSEGVSDYDRMIDHLHATAEMLRRIEERNQVKESDDPCTSSELVSWFVGGLKDDTTVKEKVSDTLLFILRHNFLLQRSSMMTTVKEKVSDFDRRIDHLHATAEMLRHIEEKKYVEEPNRCNDSSELVSWFINGLKDEQRLLVEKLVPRTLYEAIKIAYLDHREMLKNLQAYISILITSHSY